MVSVGIDLERIVRFVCIPKGDGSAFYRRVYTPAERLACGKNPVLLALCFTAKEAVSKALGTGLTLGEPHRVAPTDIEILWGRGGHQPRVNLRDTAQEVAQELNLSEIILYWHHNRRLACSIAGGADTSLVLRELRGAFNKSLAAVVAYMDRMDDEREEHGKRIHPSSY
jgi:phosphopantetheine--protein transferase-like protein